MGAVQRLATVVIIGLVAVSTILFLYLADESNRQDAEVKEQDDAAIERGIANYLQYCLPCHGPAGEGRLGPGEEGTGRIGLPLGGNTYATRLNQEGIQEDGTPVAGGVAARTTLLNRTIHEGRGAMPAWGAQYGGELNDDQISNLVYMIQHVDWNQVYNEAVTLNGGYPTAPPGTTSTPAASPTPGGPQIAAKLEAFDIGWKEKELTIGTGKQIIAITNTGASLHDFSIDELGIKQELQPGQTVNVTIDAPAGTYQYYCSVPGHKEAGMVGTLTVKEGYQPPAQASPPAGSPSPAASPGPGASPPAAAGGLTIELQDILFAPSSFSLPANTATKVSLKNT
ncbi:MAG: cupredoxin domain-containing protein, partial [Thermomicrobiales bacterium]